MESTTYEEHLQAKVLRVPAVGFEAEVTNPDLFPFQRATVEWALSIGRCAIFADTGLGKTIMQLEWARHVVAHTGGRVLLLAPLAVGTQTVREAHKFGVPGVVQVREPEEVAGPGVYVTNYERVQKFDPAQFDGIVLDESSILKNYTGATKQYLLSAFGTMPFRLACTATPAPNDHLELGNHAEFLGVLSSHVMIARWFIADQRTAGSYRLKGHAVESFWDWVTSWARCIGKPSDMGAYSDKGYDLPPLTIHRHSVAVDMTEGAADGALFREAKLSATSIHQEMRRTAEHRAAHVAGLVRAEPDEDWIVWVETDYDADAIKAALPGVMEVRGSMTADVKAETLLRFIDHGGVLLTKAKIAGMGLNLQRCARQVYTGLSFSYERLYQAIRRSWRFGQLRPVDVHVVMAQTEQSTWSVLDRKASDHEDMKREMFAASRRAAARVALQDPYQPHYIAPVPRWLQERA